MTNPFRWPFRAHAGLAAAFCAAVLAYAIHVQVDLGIEPCPLCIFQRLAFAVTGLLALVAALRRTCHHASRAYAVLIAVPALTGAGIALRHEETRMFRPPP